MDKRCRRCDVEKPIHEFSLNRTSSDGLQFWCKQCMLDHRREYQTREPDYNRNSYYVRRFGITLAEYEALNTKQGGKCKICGSTNGRKRLAVDHDHKTGKVRGLLCDLHNRGIGLFGDNIADLESAVEYLKENDEV